MKIKQSEMIEANEITEPIVIFKVNRLYREGMPAEDLYDITRCYWGRLRQKAEQCRIALCVYRGVVKEVYEVTAWRDGEDLRKSARIPEYQPGRYGFEGHVAEEPDRQKYLGRRVSGFFRRNDRNTVKVLGLDDCGTCGKK